MPSEISTNIRQASPILALTNNAISNTGSYTNTTSKVNSLGQAIINGMVDSMKSASPNSSFSITQTFTKNWPIADMSQTQTARFPHQCTQTVKSRPPPPTHKPIIHDQSESQNNRPQSMLSSSQPARPAIPSHPPDLRPKSSPPGSLLSPQSDLSPLPLEQDLERLISEMAPKTSSLVENSRKNNLDEATAELQEMATHASSEKSVLPKGANNNKLREELTKKIENAPSSSSGKIELPKEANIDTIFSDALTPEFHEALSVDQSKTTHTHESGPEPNVYETPQPQTTSTNSQIIPKDNDTIPKVPQHNNPADTRSVSLQQPLNTTLSSQGKIEIPFHQDIKKLQNDLKKTETESKSRPNTPTANASIASSKELKNTHPSKWQATKSWINSLFGGKPIQTAHNNTPTSSPLTNDMRPASSQTSQTSIASKDIPKQAPTSIQQPKESTSHTSIEIPQSVIDGIKKGDTSALIQHLDNKSLRDRRAIFQQLKSGNTIDEKSLQKAFDIAMTAHIIQCATSRETLKNSLEQEANSDDHDDLESIAKHALEFCSTYTQDITAQALTHLIAQDSSKKAQYEPFVQKWLSLNQAILESSDSGKAMVKLSETHFPNIAQLQTSQVASNTTAPRQAISTTKEISSFKDIEKAGPSAIAHDIHVMFAQVFNQSEILTNISSHKSPIPIKLQEAKTNLEQSVMQHIASCDTKASRQKAYDFWASVAKESYKKHNLCAVEILFSTLTNVTGIQQDKTIQSYKDNFNPAKLPAFNSSAQKDGYLPTLTYISTLADAAQDTAKSNQGGAINYSALTLTKTLCAISPNVSNNQSTTSLATYIQSTQWNENQKSTLKTELKTRLLKSISSKIIQDPAYRPKNENNQVMSPAETITLFGENLEKLAEDLSQYGIDNAHAPEEKKLLEIIKQNDWGKTLTEETQKKLLPSIKTNLSDITNPNGLFKLFPTKDTQPKYTQAPIWTKEKELYQLLQQASIGKQQPSAKTLLHDLSTLITEKQPSKIDKAAVQHYLSILSQTKWFKAALDADDSLKTQFILVGAQYHNINETREHLNPLKNYPGVQEKVNELQAQNFPAYTIQLPASKQAVRAPSTITTAVPTKTTPQQEKPATVTHIQPPISSPSSSTTKTPQSPPPTRPQSSADLPLPPPPPPLPPSQQKKPSIAAPIQIPTNQLASHNTQGAKPLESLKRQESQHSSNIQVSDTKVATPETRLESQLDDKTYADLAKRIKSQLNNETNEPYADMFQSLEKANDKLLQQTTPGTLQPPRSSTNTNNKSATTSTAAISSNTHPVKKSSKSKKTKRPTPDATSIKGPPLPPRDHSLQTTNQLPQSPNTSPPQPSIPPPLPPRPNTEQPNTQAKSPDERTGSDDPPPPPPPSEGFEHFATLAAQQKNSRHNSSEETPSPQINVATLHQAQAPKSPSKIELPEEEKKAQQTKADLFQLLETHLEPRREAVKDDDAEEEDDDDWTKEIESKGEQPKQATQSTTSEQLAETRPQQQETSQIIPEIMSSNPMLTRKSQGINATPIPQKTPTVPADQSSIPAAPPPPPNLAESIAGLSARTRVATPGPSSKKPAATSPQQKASAQSLSEILSSSQMLNKEREKDAKDQDSTKSPIEDHEWDD